MERYCTHMREEWGGTEDREIKEDAVHRIFGTHYRNEKLLKCLVMKPVRSIHRWEVNISKVFRILE